MLNGRIAVEMSKTDVDYFRRRAAVEREMAGKAVSPEVAAVHQELARGYDALANESQQRQRALRAI